MTNLLQFKNKFFQSWEFSPSKVSLSSWIQPLMVKCSQAEHHTCFNSDFYCSYIKDSEWCLPVISQWVTQDSVGSVGSVSTSDSFVTPWKRRENLNACKQWQYYYCQSSQTKESLFHKSEYDDKIVTFLVWEWHCWSCLRLGWLQQCHPQTRDVTKKQTLLQIHWYLLHFYLTIKSIK